MDRKARVSKLSVYDKIRSILAGKLERMALCKRCAFLVLPPKKAPTAHPTSFRCRNSFYPVMDILSGTISMGDVFKLSNCQAVGWILLFLGKDKKRWLDVSLPR